MGRAVPAEEEKGTSHITYNKEGGTVPARPLGSEAAHDTPRIVAGFEWAQSRKELWSR